MTNRTLQKKLAALEKVDPNEIGMRAGQTRNLLTQLADTRSAIAPIIEAAKEKHHDIFIDPSWNEGYTVEIGLTVRELRMLAIFADPSTDLS